MTRKFNETIHVRNKNVNALGLEIYYSVWVKRYKVYQMLSLHAEYSSLRVLDPVQVVLGT